MTVQTPTTSGYRNEHAHVVDSSGRAGFANNLLQRRSMQV